MRLLRPIIGVLILSLLVSAAAGCQPQFQPGTFTDDAGRAVSIDKIPQRIVSFGPSITETLFALGLEENVVGVDDFSDYPEAAKAKPKIGSAFSPSLEAVVGLEPDLVLTLKHKRLNTELDALGIKFMVLDPKDFDGILKNIELIGKITGVEKRAKELVKEMQDSISQVSTRVKDAPKVSVFFIIDATDLNNPWTAGAGSFIDALIAIAGGENVAARTPGGAWLQFSMEQVVSSDPEVIIIQTMPGGIPTVAKEVLEEHLAWRETTAVKQGNVFFIDGALSSRSGPRIVQGLQEIAKMIHPELFD